MKFILIFLVILLVICILALIRNSYTLRMQINAADLIRDYCQNLIDNHQYDMEYQYYIEMMNDYDSYFNNIFAYGKYKAIKPEYRQLLKDFEKTR